MTEHTPTPWFYHAGLEGDLITCDPEGVVCRIPNHPENAAYWEANARFIVKAANNHDALVKALEEIADLGDVRADEAGTIARQALELVADSSGVRALDGDPK